MAGASIHEKTMALAGGHNDVPFYRQGFTLLSWLKALEMLMSHRHGSRYGRSYQKEIGGPVVWGALRGHHTTYTMNKRGVLGLRFERGGLASGSRFVDHAVDYGLRSVDALKNESRFEAWQAALAEGPILAEGRFGPGRLWGANRGVVLVGWTVKGKIVYQDALALHRYSTCTVGQLLQRTTSQRSCFWRAL
jgi:hypothetical protein